MEIKDIGSRKEFITGVLKGIPEGKGNNALMLLDVLAAAYSDSILRLFYHFIKGGCASTLYGILELHGKGSMNSVYELIIELSKHFENGANKYGVDNWKRGINTSSYVDSAIRHYCKWKDNQKDENHEIAFVWNVVCCIWTCEKCLN